MRSKDRKGGHRINWQRWGDVCRQGLCKERNTTFGLASSREKLPLEGLVMLRDEERWRTKAAATSNACIDLVIEKLLDMVYGEKMLAIHGDDDGIPDLRDEDLEG